MKAIFESFGLNNPTRIRFENTRTFDTSAITLEFVGKDIQTICNGIKEFVACYKVRGCVVEYFCSEKNYRSIQQRTLSAHKSVLELFYENGIKITGLLESNATERTTTAVTTQTDKEDV